MKIIFYSLFLSSFILSCGNASSDDQNLNGEDTLLSETIDTLTEISEKRALLTELVGEHELVSISGFMGANTMVDYYTEDGQWKATGSSIEDGMREGYEIELTQQDLDKLKSAKIVVAENLTFYYACEGNQYFKSAYNDTGMDFQLKISPADYISTIPENLEPTTTFIDHYLYLFAKDHFGEGTLEVIDIAQVWADAALLTYNSTSKQFELSLFYGECCDNSTYYFE